MATIATCPKCRTAIAVPEAAEPQSWVRCPLCGGEFHVSEALAINPPTAELIPPREGEAPAEPATSNPASHKPDFPTLQDVNPHLATHFAAIPHATESGAPRGAWQQKHLFVELTKIVLGGLAGLILGYAILFWGFRVDPFHFAKFFPAGLVPNNLGQAAE